LIPVCAASGDLISLGVTAQWCSAFDLDAKTRIVGVKRKPLGPQAMNHLRGGYFKTGRSLALTGIPNNQLLVSLCDGMGFPVAMFGEPRYGGELAALKG
jgi:hypothetical protein